MPTSTKSTMSKPAAAMASLSVSFTPSIHSMHSTRRAVCAQMMRGVLMRGTLPYSSCACKGAQLALETRQLHLYHGLLVGHFHAIDPLHTQHAPRRVRPDNAWRPDARHTAIELL